MSDNNLDTTEATNSSPASTPVDTSIPVPETITAAETSVGAAAVAVNGNTPAEQPVTGAEDTAVDPRPAATSSVSADAVATSTVGSSTDTPVDTDAAVAPSSDGSAPVALVIHTSLVARLEALAKRLTTAVKLDTLEDVDPAIKAISERAADLGVEVDAEIAELKTEHNLD